MFYFLFPTLMSFDLVLIAAAVIPAVFLMIRAYRSDRLEKEPPRLLWSLVIAGVLSSLIALIAERVLSAVLNLAVPAHSSLYSVLLYFVIVAFSEEGAKYLMLKRRTWRSPEFNCQYDGIVYALFVSLGFALWENISYVMTYGFGTAVIRALTAIPGHACFGVFMGVFYARAKQYERSGGEPVSKQYRILSVVVPALLHGAYDYIASSQRGVLFFVGFIVILFVVSYALVSRMSKEDRYL